MAKEKKEEKPLAYIDYSGDSSASAPGEYTPSQFYDYWKRALIRTHKMSTQPLTIKERALWKRLITAYEPEALIKMIDRWMVLPGNRNRRYSPADFVVFYSIASDIYDQIKEKDYSWE